MHDLIDFRRHRARFISREELCNAFKIDRSSRILLSGVDHDHRIEPWWALGQDRASVLRELATLGIELITSPNFSLMLDHPRTDDMHSMKRIAICHSEVQEAGIASALHPNGRTERDFERWGDFLAERPEIVCLSYEFSTGAGLKARKQWHISRLASLVERAGRDLDIVVRGEPDTIPLLRQHFRSVTYVETTAFMKTLMRKSATRSGNTGLVWSDAPTAVGVPIDGLLEHNSEEVSNYLRLNYFDRISAQVAA